jgi:hypothetical protein
MKFTVAGKFRKEVLMMSKILEDMLGKDGNLLSPEKLLLKLDELEKRIKKLEQKNEYGGVYVDGSPKIVQEYYKNIIEEEKKSVGGGR